MRSTELDPQAIDPKEIGMDSLIVIQTSGHNPLIPLLLVPRPSIMEIYGKNMVKLWNKTTDSVM